MRVGEEDMRPDQDIVRPGTSAALTARAIDATPPPPLVQAQEAVATAIPRLVEAVPAPVAGISLGLSILLVMAASPRFRLRMAPVVMSGLLLMPVSNYHKAQEPDPPRAVEAVARNEEPDVDSEWQSRSLRHEESEWQERSRRDEESEWEKWRSHDDDAEQASDERRSGGYSLPNIQLIVPPDLVDQWQPLIELVVPDDWSREETARYLRRNSERLRREIRRLRLQHELEVRGRVYTMEHRHRSERR